MIIALSILATIHLGQWISAKRIEGVVNLVNKLKPDLIAITGDSVSYVVNEPVLDMLRFLKNLKPNDATVAVLGNHDHWVGPEEIRKVMKESNIIELENDIYTLKRGDAILVHCWSRQYHPRKTGFRCGFKRNYHLLDLLYYWLMNQTLLMKVLQQEDLASNFQDIHTVDK